MPRGKPSDVYAKDGSLFNRKKTLKDGSELLHCLKRKAGCTATAYLRPSKLISVHGSHNHIPDDAKAEAKVARRELLQTANTTKLKPREAIVLAKSGLSAEALDMIGSDDALRRSYQRARPSDAEEEMADALPSNFVGKYASTLSGAPMLMYDSGVTDVKRFVIFASDEQLKLLDQSTEISIDATFEAAPEGFGLLWSIHCRHMDKFYLTVVVFLSGSRSGLLATPEYARVIMALRQDPRLQNWIVERIYSGSLNKTDRNLCA